MKREEFLRKIKKLGFPVMVQGREQLAERSQESVETISQRLQKNYPETTNKNKIKKRTKK